MRRLGRAAPRRRAEPLGARRDAVMRRPILVLVPVAHPAARRGLAVPAARPGRPRRGDLPAGLESRDAYLALQNEFASGETTPITVVATTAGDPSDPATALVLARYAATLAATPASTTSRAPTP